MGFRVEPRRMKLTFDGDLEGLEILAKSVSVREYNELMRLPNDQEGSETLIGKFSEALVSWNLEDEDGNPVPCTAEGVQGLDSALAIRLIAAWREGLVTVPPTLPAPSSNGQPPPDLGLAQMSKSLPS